MTTKVISDAEIAAAAKAAGWSGEALVKIVAIALAESSGNVYAHNKVPPDDSYGLTQINMIDIPAGTRVKRRKMFGITRDDQLYDPVTNFKAAKVLYDGRKGNFNDWSTYIYGQYFAYLPRARKAAGSPASAVPGISGGQVSQVGFTDDASSFVAFLTDVSTWKRAGFILAGSVLILVSLSLMSGAGSRAKALVNVASNVLPVGRVAKAATAATAVKGS